MVNKKIFISFVTLLVSIYLSIFANVVIAQDQMEDADELFKKGENYYKKGNFEYAAISWEKALKLYDSDKETSKYINTVVHLADAYQSLGYHQRALSVLTDSKSIAEKNTDKACNVRFLSRMGDIYFTLGDMGKVVEYMVKGVEEAREANNPRVLASMLNNVANAVAADKDYKTATMVYEEALSIVSESEEDLDLKAKILLNFVRLEYLKGNYKQVVKILDSVVMQIGELPDSHNKASSFITLSFLVKKIRKKLDPKNKYLTNIIYLSLNEAKRISKDLKDFRISSYSNGYLGKMYENENRIKEAFKLTRKAIFFAEQGKHPEILYLWQWQLGRLFKKDGKIVKAMDAYEKSIETLNPIRQELFLGYRSKQDFFNSSVKPVYLGKAELLLIQSEMISDETLKEKKLKEARDTMELLKTAELEDFFKDECVTMAKVDDKDKLTRTPPNTAILYPVTLPDSLAILITLPDGMKYFNVPVGSETISKKVLEYRKKLQTRPNNRFLYDSQQIYDWVIRPVEQEFISRDINTLVVAPDGSLRLIPFSTLHDGKKFLIEKYAISTIPAISLTDPKPVNKEKFKILLCGLAEGRQGFSPLPSVPAELRDIKKIMSGKVLIKDKDYTIQSINDAFKAEEYSLLHVATHGVFGGTPEESFLLTYESKLNMNLLEKLIQISRFREQKVELLTLSACQTALGNERAAMGLAGVAVKAGVKAAIATLWFVDDEATSIAIREFYRQLLKPELTKAQAMQNVQKKMISQRRYWHPLYWAPFLVIGNWM